MNKRQRTAGPDQWSYVSKAWNASSLAEQVTKLSDENEELSDTLQTCSQHLEYYKKLYEQAQEKYEKYKAGYQRTDARAEELVTKLKEAGEAGAAAATAHADDVEQKQKIAAVAVVEKQVIIDTFTAEVAELKRENAEYRARTKAWRVRYEKLVQAGATALATKTVSEYGVTPDEVTLYKNFAQKQAAAAKATKLAQEAAIEATAVGFKSLTNA